MTLSKKRKRGNKNEKIWSIFISRCTCNRSFNRLRKHRQESRKFNRKHRYTGNQSCCFCYTTRRNLRGGKPLLAKEGYDLQVTVFDDYVQPNEVVDSGDFDANYFQHVPYMEQFNKEKGTKLVDAGDIHYEPFGIYPGTKKSLDEIADGDEIAVPNDTTNEARALLLLQDNGLIKLKDGAGLTATVNDIAENPHNIKIVELEAAQVARVTGETAFVVLNGNYALQAGYSVKKDALAYEASDSEAAKTYVNIIAVKEGNEDSDAIKALVKVLKSDDIKKFIDEKYDGAVIAFE